MASGGPWWPFGSFFKELRGKSILYLASASAPLLRSKASAAMDGRDFELLPGSGALRKSGAQPRAFLAPWSKASVAAMGSSCLLHCASPLTYRFDLSSRSKR